MLTFLSLSGCAVHSVQNDSTPKVRSGEDAIIEYRLISPTFYDRSRFAENHIYGKREQLEFIEGFADVLEKDRVFESVGTVIKNSKTENDNNKIIIEFVHSSMATPEPVLQLIVRIKIHGKNKVGILNEYHIESDTRLGAFMDMSTNGQKNKTSKRLAEAISEDLERYFDVNKSELLVYSDISFVPPRGKDWVLIPQNTQNEFDIAIGANTGSPTHTFYVAIHAEEISQQFNAGKGFAKYASTLAASDYDDSRFTIIESDFESTNRFLTESIIYHQLIEDNAAPNAEGKISYIEVSGYYFIHPSKKNILMNVFYSERYQQDEKNIGLRAKGESFLDSIRVIDE